ncbi:MAG: hypothetical protein WC748_05225 [Legionellales bacterium]|jgi:hypothetical protein
MKLNSASGTKIDVTHENLAIKAARHRDKEILQILLGIEHAKHQALIQQAQIDQADALVNHWLRLEPTRLKTKFYGRLIETIHTQKSEEYNLAQSLATLIEKSRIDLLTSYVEEVEIRHSAFVNGKMVYIPHKDDGEINKESAEFVQAMTSYTSLILDPFMTQIESLTKSLRDTQFNSLQNLLQTLIEEERLLLKTIENEMKEQEKITHAYVTYQANYEFICQQHKDRIWRTLPRIHQLISLMHPDYQAPKLFLAGHTEIEILNKVSAEISQQQAKAAIEEIQKSISQLELVNARVNIETSDEHGYTLLYLVAKGKDVANGLPKKEKKHFYEHIHCDTYTHFTQCLELLELLIKDYQANVWVHDPCDFKGYDLIAITEAETAFPTAELKKLVETHKLPVVLKNAAKKVRILGGNNHLNWKITILNEQIFHDFAFPIEVGIAKTISCQDIPDRVYHEITSKKAHAHSKFPTLFHLFNHLPYCNRAFLNLLYTYGYQQRPQYRILEGGLNALVPHDKKRAISYTYRRIAALLAQHEERLRMSNHTQQINFMDILSTNVAHKRKELDCYQTAMQTHIKKYDDLELLFILIADRTKEIEHDFFSRNEIHTSMVDCKEANSESISFSLPQRELACITMLSLISLESISIENTALRKQNESLTNILNSLAPQWTTIYTNIPRNNSHPSTISNASSSSSALTHSSSAII